MRSEGGPVPHGLGVFIDTDNMNIFTGRFEGEQIVNKTPNIRVTSKNAEVRLGNTDSKEYLMGFMKLGWDHTWIRANSFLKQWMKWGTKRVKS